MVRLVTVTLPSYTLFGALAVAVKDLRRDFPPDR